ncbi:TraR/DksA family transcriptional regulator [Alkalimonas mucilaginosa]|uniref:TraR/DksA family transcriptional regulator n=1 Tax=Alkalimonas mucilaginosa TaxID=3057676 RepID=A0ABU7JH92_9GAMM|nr:TraR/DksA family transcriptional regulator [Alkalimonas sp. MEB004]MEE2025044.1 TraR/DksA family transcriptional regulator [Alkalimonas sp. MEB004]
MPDIFDRAAELEQRQRDQALTAALNRPKEPPRQDENGRYCISCGIQIPAARLAIVPSAVRCVSCQQEHE